jgi:hypothetical protein
MQGGWEEKQTNKKTLCGKPTSSTSFLFPQISSRRQGGSIDSRSVIDGRDARSTTDIHSWMKIHPWMMIRDPIDS